MSREMYANVMRGRCRFKGGRLRFSPTSELRSFQSNRATTAFDASAFPLVFFRSQYIFSDNILRMDYFYLGCGIIITFSQRSVKDD